MKGFLTLLLALFTSQFLSAQVQYHISTEGYTKYTKNSDGKLSVGEKNKYFPVLFDVADGDENIYYTSLPVTTKFRLTKVTSDNTDGAKRVIIDATSENGSVCKFIFNFTTKLITLWIGDNDVTVFYMKGLWQFEYETSGPKTKF